MTTDALGYHLAETGSENAVWQVDYRLGSFYTSLYPHFKLNAGDEVELVLNGAAADVHVAYGAPITP